MLFAPTGLITLTTDFGTLDPYAGIVKGRILGRFPGARIVDLCHGIHAGRQELAGFWLGRAWLDFPPGTVHLAVVDPGVGTARGVVLAIAAERLLLAPDNGLLPEALRAWPSVRWFAMDLQLPSRLDLGALSRTFHGRDLFAPVAAALASGELTPEEFGAPAVPQDPAPLPSPGRDVGGIIGQVVITDRFGNLITNIGEALLASCRQPVVEAGRREWPVLPTYGSAEAGAPLALVNAFGLLELAIHGGNAATASALGEGSAVRVRDGIAT
jgi:S-adenosyl-L-methionine hydrolase (adenosine-forming)